MKYWDRSCLGRKISRQETEGFFYRTFFGMASKILVVADASSRALAPILDALGVLEKNRLSLRVFFLSFLSVLSKKKADPLGPNALFFLMQEEKEILESAKNLFTWMDIPCSFQFVTTPDWERILDEIENGDQDLIILQGRFLRIWSETYENFGLCAHAIYWPKCPVLVINQQKETTLP